MKALLHQSWKRAVVYIFLATIFLLHKGSFQRITSRFTCTEYM